MLLRGVQLLQCRHINFTCAALKLIHHGSICGRSQYRQEYALLCKQAQSRLSGSGALLPLRCRSTDSSDSTDKDLNKLHLKVGKDSASKEGDLTLEVATTSAPGFTQTKNFEVKTPKGILTITTTIEDSKINEIVFEKSELTPIAKLNEPVLVPGNININNPTKVQETSTDGVLSMPQIAPTSTPSPLPRKVTPGSVVTPVEGMNMAVVKAPLPATAAAPTPTPKRPRFDYRASLERNFVTPARAISDFMLTAADLECLPKIKRRSPYEQEPPMTVFWRRDVESKALEVWGSRENLLRERLKREVERKQHQQNLFTVKRRLRDYRREMGSRTTVMLEDRKGLEKSSQVVATAIAINAANLLFKIGGWLYSGSHSMFAECIHSLADLINQLILAFGIYKSSQLPDTDHPYGYMNMRYVSSLISGVGIFCMGCGLSVYHGIEGILNPEPITDLFWVYCILMGSLVSEGATLVVAINELKRSARIHNVSFREYVVSGKDPCVNVVLCEDAAAVVGVIIAGSCMALSSYTGSPIFDAAGSLLIGGLLGAVASFIIYTNANALVGVSISTERLEKINSALEADVMIRAIYDVKGIDIGNARVRYKAELDFDGRELTRSYLDKQDLNKLLAVVRSFKNVEELEAFLLDQGENIVDLMGGEIDRIEMNLRTHFPEIRHVDLEIL
ncbi:zinc transporter 9-like isoform X2 [Scaptodrosophila lebanonensis]|uniref:Proton-coupled zinc antiporter SLC30A9, mitochondrial n=1 Tax=Drosophila lebanonensis TaxID=7225 RepID=A0A6J2SYZ1_DROLE|nr:zinc transporter 9-like isoform X2 [Scaptodrosophila lebanonensis]XP_030369144.1 zinc transporter 9-like isoform X2 [Scaptodrosophila lebanonensis]